MQVRKEVCRVSAARRSLALLGCLALLLVAACGSGGGGGGDEGDGAVREDVGRQDAGGEDGYRPDALPPLDVPGGADVPPGDDTPGPGPDVPAPPDAAAPQTVVVNEVVARAPAGGADWVELYNPTLTTMDLSGWVLRDSGEDVRFVIPDGTTIQAGGFLVLYGPGGTGTLVFEFGLGSADSVRLFDAASTLVDETAWVDGDAPEGGSWGRYPDGSGRFRTLRALTPGEPNALGGPAPAQVVVNEVVARAVNAGPDWIELYNAGDETADLAGWILRDENDDAGLTLPVGTTLEPGAFLLLEGPGGATEPTFDFGLGASDAVRLFDAGGVAVDRTEWVDGQAPEGNSWGRYPDGTGAFRQLAIPSPGEANGP